MTFLASNYSVSKSGPGYELTLENKTRMTAAKITPGLAARLLADLAVRMRMMVHPMGECCCQHCPKHGHHAD